MKNTRRIPLDEGFMDKATSDILYGYISLNATYNPEAQELYITNARLLEVKESYYYICCKNITKRTINNRIKKFIDGGYMIAKTNNKGDLYYVLAADSLKWEIINYQLLEYLVATRNDNCIKIYCYLLNKYKWKRGLQQMYSFTIKELCMALGYSESSAHNSTYTKPIALIVESLAREGYIKYENYYEGKAPRMRLTFVAENITQLNTADK